MDATGRSARVAGDPFARPHDEGGRTAVRVRSDSEKHAMAILQMLKGETPRQQFELTGPRTIIGRHPECHIVLELNSVSRQHAQIIHEGDRYCVEDMGSRNGTFVNGKKVKGRLALKQHDRIKIGEILFTFHLQPTPSMLEEAQDGENDSGGSTILSTLDASSSSRLRLEVKPEAKLRAILEISKNLSQALVVDEVLPKILQSLFKIFPQADNGYVVLKDRQTGRVVPKAIQHRSGHSEETGIPSRTIVQQAMASGQAIRSADAVSDDRFRASESIADFRIRSMLCAPLMGQEHSQALGVIQLDTQDVRNQFQEEDLEVLVSVASIAAMAVENAQLHEAAVRQQRLQQELDFARQVQIGFLPTDPPQMASYRFYHYYEAAQEVGGDYFDYVWLPGGNLAIALGDVAGKGVPAALLMAKLSAMVEHAVLTEAGTAAALTHLDRELDHTVHEHHFITCVLGILDGRSHELTLANAGHPPPLLRRRRSGEVVHLAEQKSGLPLGVAPDIAYDETNTTLEPGDMVVLYSDGVTEAKNDRAKLYELERLAAAVASGPTEVGCLGQAVLDDVHRFVAGHDQSDDITLICFGRTE